MKMYLDSLWCVWTGSDWLDSFDCISVCARRLTFTRLKPETSLTSVGTKFQTACTEGGNVDLSRQSKHLVHKNTWKLCQMWGIFRHTQRVCYLTFVCVCVCVCVCVRRAWRQDPLSILFLLISLSAKLLDARTSPQLFVMERCTHSAFGCVWERAINVGIFM